jgi:hypothetical protein
MSISVRQNRAVVRVSGADAAKLLNDVLTANISQKANMLQWWALLSPQGKIQAEGLVEWHDNAFWLDVHTSILTAFLKRMRLYKMRATVELEDLSDSHKVGWSNNTQPDNLASPDSRAPSMGRRVIAKNAKASEWTEQSDDFPSARISNGIVELGSDFEADQYFPHDIGMDLLAGVDFSKGCYIGQEVVSRMQHRSTARRRPVIVSDAHAPAGTPILVGSKQVGVLGQVVNAHAVAIARLDRVPDADAATVLEQPVHLALPSWASYRFADSLSQPESDPN